MPDLDFFEILRFLAIIIGMIYQSRILFARLGEMTALKRPSAKATPIELEVLNWHLERGWIIMVCHLILLVVGVIAHQARDRTIETDGVNMLRIVIDLLWTSLVVLLSMISWRANLHYDRLLNMMDVEEEVRGWK